MNRFVISTLLIGLLSACASTSTLPEQSTFAAQASKASSASTAPVAAGQTQQGVLPHQDPKNLLSQKRSVYFDLDQFLVRDEFQAMLQAHANYLNSDRNRKITVEGNADEQGSREYNLALGQKRAQAVRKTMSILGVQDNQVEAISWGEERPKATGHDESAWAQNRRADIKYSDEK